VRARPIGQPFLRRSKDYESLYRRAGIRRRSADGTPMTTTFSLSESLGRGEGCSVDTAIRGRAFRCFSDYAARLTVELRDLFGIILGPIQTSETLFSYTMTIANPVVDSTWERRATSRIRPSQLPHFLAGRTAFLRFFTANKEITINTVTIKNNFGGPMVAYETESGASESTRTVHVNLFTWYAVSGNGVRRSARASSPAALLTFGPAVMLLHELSHIYGCIIENEHICTLTNSMSRDAFNTHEDPEPTTATVTDQILSGSSDVIQRRGYGQGGTGTDESFGYDLANPTIHHFIHWPEDRVLLTGNL
jgi:hypothetical protein